MSVEYLSSSLQDLYTLPPEYFATLANWQARSCESLPDFLTPL